MAKRKSAPSKKRGHSAKNRLTSAAGRKAKSKGGRRRAVKHEPSESALLDMMDGVTQKAAAKRHGISRDRLRRYLKEQTRATYLGGDKWKIREKRPIYIRSIEDGRLVNLYVDRRGRTVISAHWSRVGAFVNKPTPENLAAVQGQTVRDTRGKLHRLEDRPNVLRRLANAGELSFLTIYADTPSGGISP